MEKQANFERLEGRVSERSVNPALSTFLDFSRWIAAFLVVNNHLRSIAFVDYNTLQTSSIFLKAFYFLTSYGKQAVIVFFVLSGFLIGGTVLKGFEKQNFNLLTYSVNRFSRIYSVFLPALLIGLFLDSLGFLYFNQFGVYTHQVPFHSMDYAVSDRLSSLIFLSNVLMLQNVFSSTLGSNAPLWSLANEWWYYFLFPLCALCAIAPGRRTKIVAFGFALSLCLLIRGAILLYFSIWLLGVLPHFLKKPLFRTAWLPGLACLGILLMTKLRLLEGFGEFGKDFLLGIWFMLTINSLQFQKDQKPQLVRLHQSLAQFSYSLYLYHFPFLLLLAAVMHQTLNLGLRMQPTANTLLIYLGMLLSAYIYALGLYWLTERNTGIVKKFLVNYSLHIAKR